MSQGPRPHLTVRNENDVIVVTFEDEQIESEDLIRKVGEQLEALTEGQEGTKLLIDFSNVRYVASSLLGKLLHLQKKCAAAHGRVKLCSMTPYLRTIFDVSRLDRIFAIYDDEQSALDAF